LSTIPRLLRVTRRWLAACVLLALLAAAALVAWSLLRERPQDLPWAPLDLGQPVGLFTGRKLAALADSPTRCAALLAEAGVRYVTVPPRQPPEGQCGYRSAIRLEGGGPRQIDLSPASVAVACPVAAALALWEWNVVAPAAQRHFSARVSRIEHLGSYSCRRLYGRSSGGWSEHATANALDVGGFRLSDGTRVSVLRDWSDGGAKAAFLHEVRDGACGVFATVLSPDYNAAHRDHLHLDQAARGATAWRACR
jgi:hypothetical protein